MRGKRLEEQGGDDSGGTQRQIRGGRDQTQRRLEGEEDASEET